MLDAQRRFVFGLYLQEFVEQNRERFFRLFLHEIYNEILKDRNLLLAFHEHLEAKIFSLQIEKTESQRVHELFISELN